MKIQYAYKYCLYFYEDLQKFNVSSVLTLLIGLMPYN